MTKLEAGQVWIGIIRYRFNPRSTRREIARTSQGPRALLLHFVAQSRLNCCYERTFRAWISRTAATLQETNHEER